jgi:hypothetical protein
MPLDHEARLAFNIPAKWANRFSVCGVPYGVRVAFAEAAPDETRAFLFHGAVLLSRADALALSSLLKLVADKMPG